jgi:hypothetical protein
MNLQKFSPYQAFCTALMACLKPFTVVTETLVHRDVGERYAGLSAWVALLLLGVDAEFCPTTQSTLLWLLMVVFTARVVVLRVAGMRRRLRGDNSVHSRSPGTSLLNAMSSRLPRALTPWIEPFAVMLAALIVSVLNPTVGLFLFWSGGALLCINLIRLSAAYNRELDVVDAQVEQDAQLVGSRFFPSLGICPPAPLPAFPVNIRSVQPELFSDRQSGEAEVEPDLGRLLPVGGGAPWKQ